MIHIATVHWNSDRWLGIQQQYLKRHIPGPYRIYAWINGVEDLARFSFHYLCEEPVREHPVKLNLLADIIYLDSNRHDDILVFLDGDAFPISNLESFIREKLKSYPFMAVRRSENKADIQPHPCFAATTVGFWKSLKGDWKAGHTWLNSAGRSVTDVGGNLLRQLNDAGVEWHPLLRSNKHNPHPLFFGIYDDVIYHHTTGFRQPWSRTDELNFKERHSKLSSASLRERILYQFTPQGHKRLKKRLHVENAALSESVYRRIVEDPEFSRMFI